MLAKSLTIQEVKVPFRKLQRLGTTSNGEWRPESVATSAKHVIAFACARSDGEACRKETQGATQ